jgi:uncharacterized repeat protein (TIGR01451 family)
VATLSATNSTEVSDTADHTVDSQAVVSPTVTAKPADGAEVGTGKSITYTITFTNDATSTAPLTGVTFLDPTPAGTSYEQGSATVNGSPIGAPSGDAGDPGDPTPSPPLTLAGATNPFGTGASLADLMPGESHTVRFKVKVKGSATGDIVNTATISAANQPDVVVSSTHTVQGSGDDGTGGDTGGTGGGTGGTDTTGGTSGGTTTTVGGSTTSGGGTLANTGFGASPLLLVAIALILAGLTLHLLGRDPRRARRPLAVEAGPIRMDASGSFFFG